MRKVLISVATASALLVGAASAFAESTTTTTTWTAADGTVIKEYSTTQNYAPVSDPALKPSVGMTLPGTVKVYSLPSNIKVSDPENYSYTIINDQPVVVERSTRRVVHIW